MRPQLSSNGRAPSPPRRQRACVPCSRAKARCNFRLENVPMHVCDRCEKLGIDCAEKTTKSLRKPRQIRPLNSRVSCLEKQLQQLTTTLSDSSSRQGSNPICSAPTDHNGSPPSISVHSPSSSCQSSLSISTPAMHLSLPRPIPPAPPPNGLTWREATVILTIFRQRFMYRFPCVLIDSSTTPQNLLAEKPFVFRAVMLVAAPISVTRMKKMKRNVMAYLSHRLLVEEQRHLELLQGLLILLAWNDLDWWHDSQVTVLTYTALGLVYSLRLAKTPLGTLQRLGTDRTLDDAHQLKGLAAARSHTLEEQRAFIGLFCLVSMNSGQFGRKNPLDSQYIMICCDGIARNPETPSDYYLERLARMYIIADKITTAFGSPNDNERLEPYLFLVEGHARGIRAELSNIMESLDFNNFRLPHHEMQRHSPSPDDQDDYNSYREYFTLHYHYLLVRLYEPATYLHDVPEGQPSLYRSVCLRNCLFAAKAFFDIRFQLPPSNQIYIATTAKEHITFVITVATRLMFMNIPDWNVTFARAALDMREVLDTLLKRAPEAEAYRKARAVRFANEMSRVGVEHPDVEDESANREGQVNIGVEKLRFLRDWFEAKLRESETAPWLENDPVGSLEDMDVFECLNGSRMDGVDRLLKGNALVGATDGVPAPVQPPVTIGLGEGSGSGVVFFDGMYSTMPWNFEGVEM